LKQRKYERQQSICHSCHGLWIHRNLRCAVQAAEGNDRVRLLMDGLVALARLESWSLDGCLLNMAAFRPPQYVLDCFQLVCADDADFSSVLQCTACAWQIATSDGLLESLHRRRLGRGVAEGGKSRRRTTRIPAFYSFALRLSGRVILTLKMIFFDSLV
jgi:hypothetical protein